MKTLLYILIFISVVSCANETTIKGQFIAKDDSAFFDSITLDGQVVTFGGKVGKLMPAYHYQIKNSMVYIQTDQGILTFEIINDNTLKGTVSIVKDDIYTKQK